MTRTHFLYITFLFTAALVLQPSGTYAHETTTRHTHEEVVTQKPNAKTKEKIQKKIEKRAREKRQEYQSKVDSKKKPATPTTQHIYTPKSQTERPRRLWND